MIKRLLPLLIGLSVCGAAFAQEMPATSQSATTTTQTTTTVSTWTTQPPSGALSEDAIKTAVADAGYKGHNALPRHRFKVYTAGQKRRMTDAIKREMRRRSAIEPVIGHAKAEHRIGRNYLAGQVGDAINAVLAAAGYNFRRLLAWFTLLLSVIWMIVAATSRSETVAVAS